MWSLNCCTDGGRLISVFSAKPFYSICEIFQAKQHLWNVLTKPCKSQGFKTIAKIVRTHVLSSYLIRKSTTSIQRGEIMLLIFCAALKITP